VIYHGVKKRPYYLLGWSFIFSCYGLGEVLVWLLNIPLPGVLVGLLLLLTLMRSASRLALMISKAAQPILLHMSFFFIPAVLGIGLYWPALQVNLVAILLAIVGSTVVSLAISYVIAVKLFASLERREEKH
jgi:holin-like protein